MFNFPFFAFSITLLFLLFASYYDIKKRIVPNFLVLYLLIIGVIFKIIETIYFSQISILLNALLSFGITFIVGYILWEFGFFAGGDLKLFSAISFLNPFNINFLGFLFSLKTITIPVFSLTLVITAILSTAPILIFSALYLFIFKRHYRILINLLKTKNTLFSLLSSILMLFLISSFFNIFEMYIPFLIYFLLSVMFILFFRQLEKQNIVQYNYLVLGLYLLLIGYSLIFSKKIFVFYDLLVITITILIIFLSITFYKIISSKILTFSKKINDLKEGDVVLNNYYLVNKKVIEKKLSFINYLKEYTSKQKSNKLIIDSRKVGGLLPEDITFLKSSYKHNLEKEIVLKKTIPFTPSVLVAYILLNILGDFIWFIF